jgi:predicted permease
MRYAIRMMRKTPGFTAVAVGTLALGIGVNSAIFSVVNALVLQPLPVKDPDRIVVVQASSAQRGIRGYSMSLHAYESMRDDSKLLSGVTAWDGESLTLTGDAAEPEALPAARVAPNFFDVLGTRPVLGRGFAAAEGEKGAVPVALISYRLWQRRFAGARSVVGQTASLDREQYTIIGVLPADYPFPVPNVDVWVSRLARFPSLQPEQIEHGAGFLQLIGRLAPGATMEQAGQELLAVHKEYKRAYPAAPDGTPDSRVDISPLQESLTANIRPTLGILTGAVGFVLLIACANVAGLLMARATVRAKEMALRAALGASRAQLIWQLLSESLLLSATGAALGVLLAKWGVAWLVKADAGNNLPGFQPIGVDLAVLGFTAAVSMVSGAAFGLAPAMQASRPDLNGILRDAGWGNIGGRRMGLRSALVVAQVALSVVLLIGAGLLLESFRQVQNLRLGFTPSQTLVAQVTLPTAKYPDEARRAAFVRELAQSMENTPGVQAASLAQSAPIGGLILSPMLAEGQGFIPLGARPLARWNMASPGYFRTYGIPLLSGRDFTWADDEHAPRALIVNQTLAKHFWPNESALGKHITFTRLQVPFEIVGVVGDTRSGNLEREPQMTMYSVYAQWTRANMTIAVRTAGGSPVALTRTLALRVAAVDRDLPVTGVQSMDEVVQNAMAQRKETMYLVAGFAGLALVLAVIGLYGVMAFSVAQRTAEIGIRQAIGAQRGDILRMVMAQGFKLSIAGVVAGAVAAAALTRLMSGMLFQVSATDPVTFGAIAGVFIAVALAASYVPAWRAMRIDPVVALRER